jgi:hypothetical protein
MQFKRVLLYGQQHVELAHVQHRYTVQSVQHIWNFTTYMLHEASIPQMLAGCHKLAIPPLIDSDAHHLQSRDIPKAVA